MKIFLPPLDTVWRLLDDWTPPASFSNYGNWDFFRTYGAQHGRWTEITGRQVVDPDETPEQYSERWNASLAADMLAHDVRFPKGTVVVFDRYHVSHSGSEEITLRVLASPDQRINPKKQGGKLKGKGRFYVTVLHINAFPEVEQVHDFV